MSHGGVRTFLRSPKVALLSELGIFTVLVGIPNLGGKTENWSQVLYDYENTQCSHSGIMALKSYYHWFRSKTPG